MRMCKADAAVFRTDEGNFVTTEMLVGLSAGVFERY
jgi:hypothetical protein